MPNLRCTSSPALEPVTLTEAKTHLRLESGTFASSMTETQSIVPGDHVVAAAYSLEGSGVDVLGDQTLVVLNSGTNGASGKVDAKIQESNDDVTYTDWTGGAFTQVTEANDNAIQEKEYTGDNQYIRVVATVATATCDFSATIVTKSATRTDDDLISDLITVAREAVEDHTKRALITQTWELRLDEFDETSIWVNLPPLQSVTSITYVDTAGDTQTLSTDYYTTHIYDTPGRIDLAYGYTWPSTYSERNVVKVTFIAGYGDAASDVPKKAKQAMLLAIGTLYENWQSTSVVMNRGELIELVGSLGFEGLLSPMTVREF